LQGVSLSRGKFSPFAYRRHTHDEYASGVTGSGAARFSYGGGRHIAQQSTRATLNPDEIHDGEPAASSGCQYLNGAGFSKYHFLRMLKSKLGISPNAHLMMQRAKHANRAIEKGRLLQEVAAESGFADQSPPHA
jgi:hypothetical protein